MNRTTDILGADKIDERENQTMKKALVERFTDLLIKAITAIGASRRTIALFVLAVVLLSAGCDSQSARNQDHIIKYMENKYGIEFKILGARSNGTNVTSSYNVMSPEYPGTVTTVGVMEAGSAKEWINEDYGFILFRDQWEDHYRTRLRDFFGDKVYLGYGGCLATLEDTAVFQAEKVDLKALSFEKLGESGGGLIYGNDISIFFIRDMPDDNYEPIYQEVFNWLIYLKKLGMTSARFQMNGYAEKSLSEPEIAAIAKKVSESGGHGAGSLYDALMDHNPGEPRLIYGSGFAVVFDLKNIETIDDVKTVMTIKWKE